MVGLAILFALELGVVTDSGWLALDSSSGPMPGEQMYMTMEAEVVVLDMLFILATVRTDANVQLPYGYPLRVHWGVNYGARLGFVELGFRHWCYHPIAIYTGAAGYDAFSIEGGHSEVYLRISGGR